MYSHPAALEILARQHQEELWHEARNARLAREAAGHDSHTAQQHGMVALAVVALMALALVLLI